MYHLIDYVWCVERFAEYFDRGGQQQQQPAQLTDSSVEQQVDSNNNNTTNASSSSSSTSSTPQVYSLLTSPVFSYKNTRWVLNLYPEGLGDSASQGYISLFIKYVSEDPECINARVELSLLNGRNERVYMRDTGDHQYQTFIDFGYKQFLKIAELRDQRDELLVGPNGTLKVFARVEFEHGGSLPTSLTWTNYDLLLFKENFKQLYETKHLCDIVLRIVKKGNNTSSSSGRNNLNVNSNATQQINSNQSCLCSFNLLNSNSSSRASSGQTKRFKSDSFSESGNGQSPLPGYCNCSLISDTSLFYSSSSLSSTSGMSMSSIDCMTTGLVDTGNEYEEVLEIKSHKFILASRSGKFRELLKTDLQSRRATTSATNMTLVTNNSSADLMLGTSSIASSSSSSSPSFESSLSSLNTGCCFNSDENETSDDNINDLLVIETDRSPRVIEYLVRYMYSGYLDSLEHYAKDIYEVSKEYKVHGLTNLAREHLIKELNIQNCCDLLVFCVVQNDYDLNNRIQAFIRDNYDTVLKTNSYKWAKRKYRELFENTINEIGNKRTSNGNGSSGGSGTGGPHGTGSLCCGSGSTGSGGLTGVGSSSNLTCSHNGSSTGGKGPVNSVGCNSSS